MNKDFQKIDIEDVCFFDSEIVRANKNLEVDTKEYELFQRKTRDRQTDEYLSDEELVVEYEKKAALKRVYNKVITIGVGFVKEGVPYIKDISGDEDYVIKEFVKIVNQFKYCCSFNGIAFDLPMIVGNGMKYFNIANKLKDDFNPSGKKQWNLGKCLDLLEIFKGTHYYPSSVEEICYHFDIPTPKDDISGAEVSQTYWYGDREKIYTYVKKDVFANINIFRKMQGKEIFEDFVDRSNTKIKDERTVLQKLYASEELTDTIKKELEEALSKKKITKKDKDNLFKILRGVWVQTDFVNMNQDSKAVIADKEAELKQFLEEL